jgi:hypothetical protein
MSQVLPVLVGFLACSSNSQAHQPEAGGPSTTPHAVQNFHQDSVFTVKLHCGMLSDTVLTRPVGGVTTGLPMGHL